MYHPTPIPPPQPPTYTTLRMWSTAHYAAKLQLSNSVLNTSPASLPLSLPHTCGPLSEMIAPHLIPFPVTSARALGIFFFGGLKYIKFIEKYIHVQKKKLKMSQRTRTHYIPPHVICKNDM